MATLHLTATTTIADLRKEFNEAFGAQLKIYNGNKAADVSSKLSEVGLVKSGNMDCANSMTVEDFIATCKASWALKVKVYTCDEWVAVLGALTLEQAGKVKKNATKADMEKMTENSSADLKGYSIKKNEKGGFSVYKNGELCDNAKGAMREIAVIIGLDVDAAWTTQQFGSKLLKAIGEGTTPVKNETKVDKVATPAAKNESAPKKDTKSAKATSSEEDALKARIAELEKELTKQKASAKEEKPAKAEKSNDPFEGLMVKVCAGMFKQKYKYLTKSHTSHLEYPGGDRRRKQVWVRKWGKMESGIGARRVTITKSFNICKYPVTQGQWKQIMGEGFNPSKFRGDDNLPVESVTFSEIEQFIEKLNKLTGKKYRLPTEAEWQWAAVGAAKDDDQGDWAGCSKEEDLDKFAWYNKNSEVKTHPVGQKKPNELGLYDMCGNVWEICADRIDYCNEDSPRQHNLGGDEATDPVASVGENYLVKGGSVWFSADHCAIYGYSLNDGRDQFNGFRLAETIE